MRVKVAHKKSFQDYLTKEDHLNGAVVKYLKLQYPKVFCVHVPNEGKRTPFEQFKIKTLGVTAGVPDLLIFRDMPGPNYPEVMYHGLAIELKVKPNKPSPEQLKCLNKLDEAGWKTEVCYDFDSTKQLIDDYLK